MDAEICGKGFGEVALAFIADHLGDFAYVSGSIGQQGECKFHPLLHEEGMRCHPGYLLKDAFEMRDAEADFLG